MRKKNGSNPPSLTGGYSEENWNFNSENLGYSSSIDWLQMTFNYPKSNVLGVIPDSECFTPIREIRGRNTYTDGVELACGASVFVNPENKGDGVHFVATGKAMRLITDEFGSDDNFIKALAANGLPRKVTRLDVANDLLGANEVSKMIKLSDAGKIKTRMRPHSIHKDWQVEGGGLTAYWGSPTSDFRLRVYDKAAQLKLLWAAWTRFEFQLRNEVSTKALELAAQSDSPLATLKGVCKSRFDVKGAWYDKIMGKNAVRLKLPSPAESFETWLLDTVFGSILKRASEGRNVTEIKRFIEMLNEVTEELKKHG